MLHMANNQPFLYMYDIRPTLVKRPKNVQHGHENVQYGAKMCGMVPKICGMVPKMCGIVPKMCGIVPKRCGMLPKMCSMVSKCAARCQKCAALRSFGQMRNSVTFFWPGTKKATELLAQPGEARGCFTNTTIVPVSVNDPLT